MVSVKDTLRYRTEFNKLAQSAGLEWAEDSQNPGQPDSGEFKLNGKVVWQMDPTFLNKVAEVRMALENKRREGVKKAVAARPDYVTTFDIRRLLPASQNALPYFQKIARLTDELQMILTDPKLLYFERGVETQAKQGDPDSLALFQRGREAGCKPYVEETYCDSIAALPNADAFDPNTTAWPDDFTEEELKKLQNTANNGELLSHFTIVERDSNGYRAIPYSEYSPFRDRFLKIAENFEAVAKIPGIHEGIQKPATAYAKAIREGKVTPENHFNPFEQAEEVWSKSIGGDMLFTWGPFEEVDPYEVKRGFEFRLFAPRPKEMAKLQAYQAALQDLEEKTVKNIPGYPARPMTADSVIHASDVILEAGLKLPSGEILAHVLPNDGPLVDEGRPKREIFANVHDAKAIFIMDRLAKLSLVPEQFPLYNAQIWAMTSALHEMSHTAGPRGNNLVAAPQGKITAKTAIGAKLYGGLEESKANIGGIDLYEPLQKRKLATREEAEQTYVTYVVNLLRQIRFGAESSHGRGAAAELGYLFQEGGVEIVRRQGMAYVQVNLKKMPHVATSMYFAITTAQFEGSREKAEKFQGYQNQIAKELNSDGEIVARFKNAEPPVPADVVMKLEWIGQGGSDIKGARQ